MMKKIIICILGCVVSAALLAGTFMFMTKQDKEGPDIKLTADKRTLAYNEKMTESELLEAFQAVDKEEGDVTDSLMVEKVTWQSGDETARIVVAAMDSQYNVTKETYKIPYIEWQAEEPAEEKAEDSELTVTPNPAATSVENFANIQ